MTLVIDCSTCGGPMPAHRRCCPHCHCKSVAWKQWALAASAALSLAACGGDDTTGKAKNVDMTMQYPEGDFAYGIFDMPDPFDDASQPDGGTDDGGK